MVVSAQAWERDLQTKRVITHSELQTAKDCLQKWQWRYGFGYRKHRIGPSTLFGSAIHRALEIYYVGRHEKTSRREILKEGKLAIYAIFDKYIINHYADLENADAWNEQKALCEQVFQNYVDHYWDFDFFPAVEPVSGRPLVEMEFRVPVFTPAGRRSSRFVMGGKVDAIVMHEGEYWVLEHKTRDSISESSFDRLLLDQQTRSYCHNAQIYLGVPVAGVIYNIIRRRTPGEAKINQDGTVSSQRVDMDPRKYRRVLWEQAEFLNHQKAFYDHSVKEIEELKAQNEELKPIIKDGKLARRQMDMKKYQDKLAELNPVVQTGEEAERKFEENEGLIDGFKETLTDCKFARSLPMEKYNQEIERQESVKFFERHPQPYSEIDYAEIQMEIYQVSKTLIEAVWFPKNDAACDHWGGCAYRPLCMGLDPAGQFVMMSDSEAHTELSETEFHPPKQRGYKYDLEPQFFGEDAIYDAVNL